MINSALGVHGLPVGFQKPTDHSAFNRPELIVKPKPKTPKSNDAIQYYGDLGGCGWWRMQMPEITINYSKLGIVTGLYKLIPDPKYYTDIKAVRLQRQASPEHANFFAYLKKISIAEKFKMIYEIDDIIFKDDIPEFNKAKSSFNSADILKATIEMMNMSDVLTVTCDFMKKYYLNYLDHDNIQVVPNMPSRMWFDNFYKSSDIMRNFDNSIKRPRILYAGSGNHFDVDDKGVDDDFTHVKDYIIKSRREFEWVFLGSIPRYLHQYVKTGEMEFHPWTVIMNYPKMIHDLNINAVIAPLMDCTFNKAKSNIKYLESACLGIPGVFQDIVTYADAPLRFTDGNDMLNKIRKLFDNRQYYAKLSKQARMFADRYWLDDHIDIYTDLLYN